MKSNLESAGFKNLYPELFVVSSRVLYCCIVNKKPLSCWIEMDEQSLLQWLCKELKKRERD